ncbi:MAG: polysaccharide deacetylase family protein [Propionibacteriaceae bacterium]|nr:polysaccharide deacetylase family protein [Propionibacteriaceae bacterium]
MRVSRRGMLIGGLGLAGCAPGPGVPGPGRTDPPTDPASPPAAPSPTATPASPPHSPAAPAAVSRDSIVATYDGRPPGEFGLAVRGVVSTLPATDAFALTFDACGGASASAAGMAYDADLIAVLRRHRVPATLFLNSRWIAGNREIAADLASDELFELANHGTAHVPLSVSGASAYDIRGSRDAGEVYDEISGAQADLTQLTGRVPRFFRAGTAHVDETSVEIAGALGLKVVNFSVNADAGATASRLQVAAALRRVRGGDIVIGHVNRPPGETAEGLAAALPALLDSGLRPVRLGELL